MAQRIAVQDQQRKQKEREGKEKAKRQKHKKVDRLTRAERRARLLAREQAWVEQWVVFASTFVQVLLKADVEKLLGRPRGKWGDRRPPTAEAESGETVESQAECNKCHKKWRGWFRRNGTYPRTLQLEGIVIDLLVPRLRCHCGGSVDFSFSVFSPYQRISPELEERLRELTALGLNLRQIGEVTKAANGGPLAKSTINARILELRPLVEAFRQGALERVPPVVLLDGIFVTVLEPTGEPTVDKNGRRRPKMRRRKVGLLVAYGVDPRTGEWWVLDWQRAATESTEDWAKLLERLRERGLREENGLQLVVSDGGDGLAAALELVDLGSGVKHQLCIFHKLRNVRQAVQAALAQTREEKRAVRRQVVQEAAAIYQAADREKVLEQRSKFVEKWQASEPEAVATLLREFEKTIVYLEIQAAARSRGEEWEARYLRTTSALERVNRTIRRMVRQVVLLHSEAGLETRVYLTLLAAGKIAIPRGHDWQEVVEDALAVA